jgi:tetratricopeptide (TPR) repeat protein
MLLFQLEESIGNYIKNFSPTLSHLPENTVNNIITRSDKDIELITVNDILEQSYLDEVFQISLELTKNTSINPYIVKLRELFINHEIFMIRNILAHPNRPFIDEYWYRIGLIASNNIIEIIGLNDVKEALISAESGTIKEPPEDWLTEIKNHIIPNNLPSKFEHTITGLVGRKKEETELNKFISNPRVNTLSVVAQGGIGKTALVLDLLHKLVLKADTSNWCDAIIFIDMKLEKLTLSGITELSGLETLEEVKKSILDETNKLFGSNCISFEELLDEYKNKRMLIFIDNLETLLRDEQNAFEQFNLDLPRDWRLLVTSRITVSNATTIVLKELDNKSASQLAKIYLSRTGHQSLDENNINSIINSCYNNPLAIRLSLDLYIAGYELPISINMSQQMITEFSFNNLIEKLSENSIKVLESLYIDSDIDRIKLCQLLDLNIDEISQSISELSKTSLISRKNLNNTEIYNLSSSIRNLLLVSPRNIKIRNKIHEQLKKAKVIDEQIKRTQDQQGLDEFNIKYIPNDMPPNLKILVKKLNSSKAKDEDYTVATEVYSEFIKNKDLFDKNYFFHRTLGRIYYILKDFDEAINSFKKAFDLNKEDNLSIYLIANTYFRGKEIFEESEKYYEILIKKQIIEEKNLSFVSSILNGYFLSLLYQLKIDKILDSTKNWSTSKNNTLVGILGTFRASAWKRKIELIQKDDHISYSSAIKNSIETFIEVFNKVGYIKITCIQAYKLIEELERSMLYDYYSFNEKSYWLEFIANHIEDINNSCVIEYNNLVTIIENLRNLDIKNNVFKDEKWEYLTKNKFEHSVCEDELINKGYILVTVKNIPSRDYRTNYIFAIDEKSNDIYVSFDSLDSKNWNDWKMINKGQKLMVKVDTIDKSNLKSIDTFILD